MLHSASVSLSRLCGRGVHQTGVAVGLFNVGSGLGVGAGVLNHSTNAFIHLRNRAINFAADVGTFGEI